MIEPLPKGFEADPGVPLDNAHEPARPPYLMHLPGKQVSARPTVEGGSRTRWCATSPTALNPNGKEKFCDDCIKARHAERMAAKRKAPVTHMPVSVGRLRRLKAEAVTWTEKSNDYLDNRATATDKENADRLSMLLGVGKLLQNTIRGMPDPPPRVQGRR